MESMGARLTPTTNPPPTTAGSASRICRRCCTRCGGGAGGALSTTMSRSEAGVARRQRAAERAKAILSKAPAGQKEEENGAG